MVWEACPLKPLRFLATKKSKAMVFVVFAKKRNGLGGMSSQTITFPYKNQKPFHDKQKPIQTSKNPRNPESSKNPKHFRGSVLGF